MLSGGLFNNYGTKNMFIFSFPSNLRLGKKLPIKVYSHVMLALNENTAILIGG